jgi:integrase
LAERTNSLPDAIREAEILVKAGTLPWIVKLYRADEIYTNLRPKTQAGYDQCIREIEAWSECAGHSPLSSIERRHAKVFYRSMAATLAKANAVLRVLRILMRFAFDEGYIETNPAEKIRLKGCAPRTVVWEPSEIRKFFDNTAYAEGRPSLALAALLAADLGQREGDLLRLTWNQYNGQVISLRQSKTGAFVDVPVSEELKYELDKTPRRSPNILVNETTGRPYMGFNFGHLFRKIARKAGIGDHLRFMDLRRTSAVELAESGCEIHEISAVTGHGLTRSQDIMEVYVPRNRTMARNAVDKRNEHRKRTKLEV